MNYETIYQKLTQLDQPSSKKTQFHHIVPKHLKTGDERVVALTMRQHALAHLLLWKIGGRTQDYIAYKFLKGLKDAATHRLLCGLGGKIQGPRNAQTNFINEIKTPTSLSLGGKKAVEYNRKKGRGPYFDPESHLKAATKGGQVQGLKNALSGHLFEISKKSKRNLGMKWITNGYECKMIHSSSQLPIGWKFGRKLNG
jgi:hypothetical protein